MLLSPCGSRPLRRIRSDCLAFSIVPHGTMIYEGDIVCQWRTKRRLRHTICCARGEIAVPPSVSLLVHIGTNAYRWRRHSYPRGGGKSACPATPRGLVISADISRSLITAFKNIEDEINDE